MPPAIRTRLFVPDALAPGASVTLDADRAHFLRHVLRLDAGAAVALFNGRDGEARAVIERFSKRDCVLWVDSMLRPQVAGVDVWLCFAPLRQARLDLVVEKATELGTARLLPVLTRHCQVHKLNTGRLAAQACEAAEQCERLDVPAIAEPVSLDDLLAGWPAGRRLLVCAERQSALPLLAVAAGLPADAPVALLVGPEGGFAAEEFAQLAAAPAVTMVSLGPGILRAETAVIAALAVLQAARLAPPAPA